MIYPHSQIWTPDTISDIHARAQGDYMLSGFSPFDQIAHFDELVFLASGLTRFPLEGYKEKCKTETILGTRFSDNPLVIDTPIYIASDASLPEEVRISLAKGSALASTALSVGGRMLPGERRAGKKLIYEIPSDAQISKSMAVTKADAIQVNVSYKTSIEQLEKTIRKLRVGNTSRIPIFVSFPAGRIREDVKAAVKLRADCIVVEGMKTTTCRTPQALLNYSRMPITAAITKARDALRDNKVLGEVNLIAATGVRNGADAAKAIALGADAVVISESALIAVGYYDPFKQILPLGMGLPQNSDEGVEFDLSASLSKGRKEKIDADVRGERLAKFVNSMTMEMALLARSLGKGDVHSLEHEDLAALTVEAAMMTGIRLSGE